MSLGAHASSLTVANISWAARTSSSGETSRRCWARPQRCPNGSMTWPARSPQKLSWSGRNTSAPASSARCQDSVDVVDHQMERHVGAAECLRRDDPHLRKLVGQHDRRVAEAKLDRHQPAVRNRDPQPLLGAEHVRVPVDGSRRVSDDDVRRDVAIT